MDFYTRFRVILEDERTYSTAEMREAYTNYRNCGNTARLDDIHAQITETIEVAVKEAVINSGGTMQD